MDRPPAEIAAELVDAINSRDPDRLRSFLDDDSEVITGRTTHTGPDAIVAWSRKEYEHLVRRYAIDEYRARGDSVLALGAVEYAWIDGGEVADSSPIALDLVIRAGRLGSLRLRDDTVAALAGFTGR